MIYFFILVPLFFFSLAVTLSNKANKYSSIIGLFFIIIMILIASLRYGTGTDYYSYESIWRDINPLDKAFRSGTGVDYLEPGFRYFASSLKILGNSSVLFFSAMAFLTLGILYAGLRKINDINIYVALSLYFTVFYMPYVFNGMRQAFAMSVFVFSLTYIINKDFKKTLLLALIAGSFHLSGFLILLAYFVSRIKLNLFYYFILGTALSYLFYQFGVLGMLIDLAFDGTYSRFAESWGTTSAFQFFIRFVIASFFVFASLKVIKTKFFQKTVIIYLLGFFIYIALADANMLAARFNMFFRVLETVLFSKLLYQSKYMTNRVLFFIFTFSLAIVTFYLNISNEDNIYKTIFEAFNEIHNNNTML